MEAATCCLSTSSPATLLDWPKSYLAHKDTNIIRGVFLKYKASAIPLDIIRIVYLSYRKHIKAGQISLFGEKLLLFKVLKIQRKDLSLIIVPESIRKVLFDHYHGGPCGGHMGEYKTL